VPGIKEEADIGAGELVGEGPDALLHLVLGEVGTLDHVEAELAQLLGHVSRIVARVLQRRGVLIGGIAHDKRHALLGCCGNEGHQQDDKTGETRSKVLDPCEMWKRRPFRLAKGR
jgi:hypothetical protein